MDIQRARFFDSDYGMKKSSFFFALWPLVAVPAARGQWIEAGLRNVMATYAENPGDYNSRVSGTSVLRFNDLPTGISSNVTWSGVGSFNTLKINNGDHYGGAVDTVGSSKYIVQRSGTGNVASTTLTLSAASAYFGLWWSAGDTNNTIKFYSGSTLVVDFNSNSLLNVMGSDAAYQGNPRNRTWNSTKPYVFINFFAMNGVIWDSIVFSNAATNRAFESDNYTTRVAAFDPMTEGSYPGIYFGGVPEPSLALFGLLSLPLGFLRRRNQMTA